MLTTEQKYQTVIRHNTFYFINPDFEDIYEGRVNSIKETLLVLKNEIETTGLRKEIFIKLLEEKPHGLLALLTLTGFSNENLKRLTTIIRAVDDADLSKLVYRNKWLKHDNNDDISEWSDAQLANMIRDNAYFRKGLVNLFFEGATIPFLTRTLPLFELKKLSISKLRFDADAIIDTLIRYKEKGSTSGKKLKNPEILIQKILESLEISWETGDLSELVTREFNAKRTMDFIIPSKNKPKLIIESFFVSTTSSGMGDKAKTEVAVRDLLKKHYQQAKFIGFVDGIGWYVRKSDLKRMVSAFYDVFTFHPNELERFENMLKK